MAALALAGLCAACQGRSSAVQTPAAPTLSPGPSPTVRTASPTVPPTPSARPLAHRPPPTGRTVTIAMQAVDRFSPSTVTIAVGDRVRVVNDDTNHHTFTDAGLFDSGDLGPSGSYTYRFTTVGTYDFVCSYHQSVGMRGTVTVR